MQALLGDGRRMFANHFFDKADAYFHSGAHPSFFEEADEEAHVAEHQREHDGGEEEAEAHEHEHDFLGPPKDWLDAFSRNFYPTKHTELSDSTQGDEREIMPWLKLSAELDPNRVQSYVVTAYWLRERLHRVDEAEQFLREGLKYNPDSAEILYELGRSAYQSRKNPDRARQWWYLALQKWEKSEKDKPAPDYFLLRDILSMLSRVEEDAGHYDLAIHYLSNAAKTAPDPELYNRRIAGISEKMKKEE